MCMVLDDQFRIRVQSNFVELYFLKCIQKDNMYAGQAQ